MDLKRWVCAAALCASCARAPAAPTGPSPAEEHANAEAFLAHAEAAAGALEWDRAAVFCAAARVHEESPRARVCAALASPRAPVPLWATARNSPVLALAFNDGKQLAAGDAGARVALFEMESGKVQKELQGLKGPVRALAYSLDGKRLASGGDAGELRLWATPDGELISELRGHEAAVRSLSFSSDRVQLASASDDKTVRLWEVQNLSEQARLPHAAPVLALGYSPDGGTLATGDLSGLVRLFGMLDNTEKQKLAGAAGAIASLSFSGDGARLLSSSADRNLRVYGVESGALQTLVPARGGPVATDLEQRLAAEAGADGVIELVDLAERRARLRLRAHAGAVSSVGLSPSGELLVSAGLDGKVRAWRLPFAPGAQALRAPGAGPRAVAFGANGNFLFALDGDGGLQIWLAALGRPIRASEAVKGARRLAVAPKSNFGAISTDAAVRVIDLLSGELKLELPAAGAPALALLPDGALVLGGGGLRIVEVPSGKERAPIAWASGPIAQLAASAGGTRLAVSAAGATDVKLLDLPAGAAVRTLALGAVPTALALSPDGALLAAALPLGVRLYDVATGEQVGALESAGSPQISLAWSPSGTAMASAGADGVVWLTRLDDPARLGPPAAQLDALLQKLWLKLDGFALSAR